MPLILHALYDTLTMSVSCGNKDFIKNYFIEERIRKQKLRQIYIKKKVAAHRQSERKKREEARALALARRVLGKSELERHSFLSCDVVPDTTGTTESNPGHSCVNFLDNGKYVHTSDEEAVGHSHNYDGYCSEVSEGDSEVLDHHNLHVEADAPGTLWDDLRSAAVKTCMTTVQVDAVVSTLHKHRNLFGIIPKSYKSLCKVTYNSLRDGDAYITEKLGTVSTSSSAVTDLEDLLEKKAALAVKKKTSYRPSPRTFSDIVSRSPTPNVARTPTSMSQTGHNPSPSTCTSNSILDVNAESGDESQSMQVTSERKAVDGRYKADLNGAVTPRPQGRRLVILLNCFQELLPQGHKEGGFMMMYRSQFATRPKETRGRKTKLAEKEGIFKSKRCCYTCFKNSRRMSKN
ncbi:uncharacterized protein [Macrobrachium rosenbergii]|uniref:uncharacterized protein isoform X2 n=1 Tax=Macrobrachium rosenbergii TaxID=79674 RepID=UPI0034D62C0D